jgi:uncharacterized protein involved in type VI secretion and phage assembly
MNQIENHMRRAAQQSMQGVGSTRYGTVSSYDPNTFSAIILMQPEGVLTGWLPIETIQVGAGWGICAAPNVGDLARVEFQEGDMSAGMVTGFFFNDSARPPATPAGEFALVHKSGSLLKFHNDGSVELAAAQNLRATVGGNASIAVTGNITSSATSWKHTGNLSVVGIIGATGNINSGAAITAATSVTAPNVAGTIDVSFGGKSSINHHHSGGTLSGGITGAPA